MRGSKNADGPRGERAKGDAKVNEGTTQYEYSTPSKPRDVTLAFQAWDKAENGEDLAVVLRWLDRALQKIGEKKPRRDELAQWLRDNAERPAGDTKHRTQQQTGGGKAKAEKLALTKILADTIIDNGEHFAVDQGGALWVYRDGVYQPKGETVVRRQVKRLLIGPLAMPERWSTHLSDEVVNYIAVDAPHLLETPPLDVVNLLNGLLDVASRKLLDHTPAFLSPVQLPIEFDGAATCPEIDTFIGQTFPEDSHALAYEIVAWLMTPDTRIQKAILALGEAGNGKSTWLRLMTTFIGKRNTSALSLQKIEADRFAAVRLLGKLANLCADLPDAALVGTDMFKKITGNDVITGEHKFHESFDFTPYSRLIFSANNPPRSSDASRAFYDRWVVIPFTQRFRGTAEEIAPDILDARLHAPGELSGLLNKALDAWARLQKSPRFSESETTRRALEEFQEVTDPFTIWLNNRTEEDPAAVIAKSALVRAYNEYRGERGDANINAKAFGHLLKRARPAIGEGQNTIDGKDHVECWRGIKLVEKTPPDGPDKGEGQSKSSKASKASTPILYHARDSEAERSAEEGIRGEQDKATSLTSLTSLTPSASPQDAACGSVAPGSASLNGVDPDAMWHRIGHVLPGQEEESL